MNLCLLDDKAPEFPNPNSAVEELDGLLAVGGNLAPSTLLAAYRQGIFPWYQHDDPILWWSPAKRCVLQPSALHISKSLRRCLRQQNFQISINKAFQCVVDACAAPRAGDADTWIIPSMIAAYNQLHRLGHAHSLEVWVDNQLVGGIYGVVVGSVFCGESMFSQRTNGSKIAMAHLCHYLQACGFTLLDCQISNPHLISMGATEISRETFLTKLIAGLDHQFRWPTIRPLEW